MPKFLIELDIDGNEDDISTVLETLLANGIFQDAINNHRLEGVGEMHVMAVSSSQPVDPEVDLAQVLAEVKTLGGVAAQTLALCKLLHKP